MNLKWGRWPDRSKSMSALGSARGWLVTTRPHVRSTFLMSGLVLILSGCTIGPKVYQSSFDDYNDAIRKTSDGQMLANLVRMRYLESPVFLQVSSLNTSFSVGANAGVTGTNVSGGQDTVGASVGGSYSENPTISFSLPESRKYYGMLMAPLSSMQILQLIDGGWNNGEVLRTALRGVNGLRNNTTEYSTYPSEPKSYDDFLEALTLIEKLTKEGLAEFKPGAGFAIWSSSIGPVGENPIAQAILTASTVYAKTAGGDLVENADGKFDLHIFSRRISLGFAPAAANSADAQRLRSLLQLDPSRNAFPMFDYEFTKLEKGRGYFGKTPAALDPEAIWDEIGIRGRSMMEIMQIASNSVQVPQDEIDKGNVFAIPSTASSQKLVIQSSKDEPTNAAIKTKYRGYWYYIADNDLTSRGSFALINAVFAVTAGTVPGANPILTLPVN